MYKLKIKIWLTTGHTFEETRIIIQKLSCEEIEEIMAEMSTKRGFKGLDDIESFDASIHKY